jgi:preprotein translocase subunit SecF
MYTGLTMSFAAIAAMGILFVVTVLIMPEATTLSNISAVLVIGLIGDILSTWLMNLGILKTYIDWRQSKKQEKYNISSSASKPEQSDKKDGSSDKKSKLGFKDKLKKKTEVEDDEIMSKIEEELEKIDNMEQSEAEEIIQTSTEGSAEEIVENKPKSSKKSKNKKSNKKVNKRKAKKQRGKGGK